MILAGLLIFNEQGYRSGSGVFGYIPPSGAHHCPKGSAGLNAPGSDQLSITILHTKLILLKISVSRPTSFSPGIAYDFILL